MVESKGTNLFIELKLGHTIADTNVDYVVVGETRNYTCDLINKAAELVRRGAKLIGANKDVRDRVYIYIYIYASQLYHQRLIYHSFLFHIFIVCLTSFHVQSFFFHTFIVCTSFHIQLIRCTRVLLHLQELL